jgi:enoyl-CoA hydratase
MALIETNKTDRIGYLTINRPEKLNAINEEMMQGILGGLREFRADRDVWVIIISGKGKTFSTGFDLSGVSPDVPLDTLYNEVLSMPQPTIAAIQGFCLAQGAGIALCCDMRVGSEDVQMGWPQALRGITSVSGPSFGSHYFPLGIAYEHLFTGKFLDAKELYRCFVVNRVVPPDKLMSVAEELAKEILKAAPLAVRVMKNAVRQGLQMSLQATMQFSKALSERILSTEDAQEGLRAFAEKRKPVWRGK